MTKILKKSVNNPSSLAQKLKIARKKLKINLAKAQLGTKIPQKYLSALESGDYGKLPEPVYTRGFITRYAEFLNLEIEDCLGFYEKEWGAFKQNPNSKKHGQGITLSPRANDLGVMNRSKLIITPEVMWGGILGVGVLGVFGYIWFAVASFAAAPSLEINAPASQASVKVERVTVSGKTDPDAELEINSQFVSVNSDGEFSEEIRLNDGINSIQINAKNKINKTTTKNLQLLAEIPEKQYGPFLHEIQAQTNSATEEKPTTQAEKQE